MSNKPKVTPIEFRKMWWSKRVDLLTKLYITFCTTQAVFAKKGLTKEYWCIKRFLEKQEDADLNILYDYVYTLDSKQLMNLTEFFGAAKSYSQQMKLKNDQEKMKEVQLEDYRSLEDCLKDLMS